MKTLNIPRGEKMRENRPTFIAVDWWEDGDVVAVAEQINLMESWSNEEISD